MDFVADKGELFANAFALADAIHDGDLGNEHATELVARGRVFLAFRYGDRLAFAPAKFIGYRDNSTDEYKKTAQNRSGTLARQAIKRVLGFDASNSSNLDQRLTTYCMQIGVELRDNKHSFWLDKSASSLLDRDRSAIHDIDSNLGNQDPEYRKRMAGHYVRDQAVRNAVLKRAGGNCEYCGEQGFLTSAGTKFLESHHIISLSEQGPDTVANVIALCPNDHRRAHFGKDWESLQSKFTSILNQS